MSFNISLSGGYSREFDRKEFLELFPVSMIGTALNDPDATEIKITSPIITPSILDLICIMVTTKSIPKITPIPNLNEASRYLLIDVLGVISDPKYEIFRMAYDINLLHMPLSKEDTEIALTFAIKNSYPALGEYV